MECICLSNLWDQISASADWVATFISAFAAIVTLVVAIQTKKIAEQTNKIMDYQTKISDRPFKQELYIKIQILLNDISSGSWQKDRVCVSIIKSFDTIHKQSVLYGFQEITDLVVGLRTLFNKAFDSFFSNDEEISRLRQCNDLIIKMHSTFREHLLGSKDDI